MSPQSPPSPPPLVRPCNLTSSGDTAMTSGTSFLRTSTPVNFKSVETPKPKVVTAVVVVVPQLDSDGHPACAPTPVHVHGIG